jgi:hypothetical protein
VELRAASCSDSWVGGEGVARRQAPAVSQRVGVRDPAAPARGGPRAAGAHTAVAALLLSHSQLVSCNGAWGQLGALEGCLRRQDPRDVTGL